MSSKAIAVVVLTLVPTLIQAQSEPLRYRWTKGHVLTYEVEQSTKAVSTWGTEKFPASNQMKLTKQWTVVDVDAEQVAILQLKLIRMRIETSTRTGDKIIFDSENATGSDPQLKKQLEQYVGVPLSVLRINNRGSVVEVKESKLNPASQFQRELPFICELPEKVVSTGANWKRAYNVVVEPPLGTGEKYPAEQSYQCKSIQGGMVEIALATEIKKMPGAIADRMPLVQAMPTGTVHFDVGNGRYLGAELSIDKTLKSGEQAGLESYQFQSSYRERLISHK